MGAVYSFFASPSGLRPCRPEQIMIPRSLHTPGSDLPVLVYRAVLPAHVDEALAKTLIEAAGGWEHRGTWGAILRKHFHPNTHECYAIFQGSSTLVLGEGASDPPGSGRRVRVDKGDVVVIPAGVAHGSLDDDPDGTAEGDRYRYVGVYPRECPRWRNGYGRDVISDGDAVLEERRSVAVPTTDPVWGEGGPLVAVWHEARDAAVGFC